MANVDRPNGFRPVGTLSGSPWTSQVVKCISDADDLFLGDIVIKNAAASGGFMGVDRSTNGTTDIPLGVVVGWEPNPSALDRKYHAASTTYGVYVCIDPTVVLEAQCDGAGTVATAAEVGLNFDYTTTAGSTTSGASNMEVDSDSSATTAATPLKLIAFSSAPDNEIGSANQKMRVIFNMHVMKSDAGTAGL